MIVVVRECKKITELPKNCDECPYRGTFEYFMRLGKEGTPEIINFCKISDRPLKDTLTRSPHCQLREI